MINDRETGYLSCDGALKLISDDEASARAVETGARLSDGDEYLDLRRLAEGVRRVQGTAASMEHVPPRKAVHEVTWTRIVKQLAALPIGRARAPAPERPHRP
jgi:hypothetical protein